MAGKVGSWPFLLVGLLVFLAAFAWRRADATFLAIEAELPTARAVAAQSKLGVADALALRDLVGPHAPRERWQQVAAEFAALRAEMGGALAAVAVAGGRGAAQAALAAGNGEPDRAWQAFASRPEALPGLRFLALRARFAARLSSADRDD